MAAGIAARAKAEGLPKMKAVMPVEPGDSRRGWASIPLADMNTMAADTLLLILVGEEDSTVGTYDGERIFHETTAVASTSKALLMMHSDDHGAPSLVANHRSPSAMLNSDGSFATEAFRPGTNRDTTDIGVVDALDYLGTWRLLDQLLEAAFSVSPNGDFFDDSKLLGMGNWSDGVPVKPLTRLK